MYMYNVRGVQINEKNIETVKKAIAHLDVIIFSLYSVFTVFFEPSPVASDKPISTSILR